MIVSQEFHEHGDEYRLVNHLNTDEQEKENWQSVQRGKGFIRENGKIVGREVARIPVDEAAMLRANYDFDYLAFSENNDKAALRRLLKRFPHWRCSEGGI